MKYFAVLLILAIVQDYPTTRAGQQDQDDEGLLKKTGIVEKLLNEQEFGKMNLPTLNVGGITYVKQNPEDEDVDLGKYIAYLKLYCAQDNPADCYYLASFVFFTGEHFGKFLIGAKLIKLANKSDIILGVISLKDQDYLEFVTVDKKCIKVTGFGPTVAQEPIECKEEVQTYITKTSPLATTGAQVVNTPVAETKTGVASVNPIGAQGRLLGPIADETNTGRVIKQLTMNEFFEFNTAETQVDGKTYVLKHGSEVKVKYNAYMATLTIYCVKDQPSDCYTLALFVTDLDTQLGDFVTAAILMNEVDETHLRKCVNDKQAGFLELKQLDGQCITVAGYGDFASSTTSACL